MPVKTELDSLLDPVSTDFFADLLSPSHTDDRVSDPLLPDDIWDKFDLEFPELQGLDMLLGDVYCGGGTICKSQLFPNIKIEDDHINHDCMWAGHCSSRQHAADEPKGQCFVPKVPQIVKTQQISVNPQSVLKPTVRAAAAAAAVANSTNVANAVLPHAPQTPPESDDEESKTKPTPVLQILNQAISDCDFEDDSDLCEYFENTEDSIQVKEEPMDIKEEPLDYVEEEEEKHKEYISRTAFAAESDHCYYKDKNATMRMSDLGLDTPSDSEEEEEIDVVSVTDKLILSSAYARMAMPTNPSTRDRQQLQRRMATAITKKRVNNNTIKTIMPIRKSSQASVSPQTTKRKENCRGPKRGRGGRGAIPRKRHHYAYSDSDPEPSEKRSLHNNMERQRRIDLRNAFEDLRVLVPEVAKKDRAAKVVILREAAQYCDNLAATSHNCERQKEDLKRRQEWLRRRVSQLRRNLAAKR